MTRAHGCISRTTVASDISVVMGRISIFQPRGFLAPRYRGKRRVSIEKRGASRGDPRKRRGILPEINCISRRYVFGGITYHGTLTSLSRRIVESHKAGAFAIQCIYQKARESGRKRGGWSRAAESVSKLKFVSGNPWQRVCANRFHLRCVTLSHPCASVYICCLWLLKAENWLCSCRARWINLPPRFRSHFDFHLEVELCMV